MQRKDYYKILGLTEEDKKLQGKEFEKILKNKYRKLAIRFHPDKQQGKSDKEKKEAEEKFKEVSEAYDTLMNHRAEYDNPTSGFESPNFGGMNMDDILRQFGFGSNGTARGGFDPFGGFDSFFGGGGTPKNVRQRGGNIRVRISLSLEDVLNGCHKKIRYKCLMPCEHCHGSGAEGEPHYERCKTCGGTGQIFTQQGSMQIITTCPHCGGAGKFLSNPCKECNGRGIKPQMEEIEFDVPKGVSDGMQLFINGKGNSAEHNNGDRGALIIEFSVKQHDKFTRDENDLIFELKIPVLKAILGYESHFDTIDGKTLSAKLPQGVEDGYRVRFRGYGLPIYDTNKRGDMIGIVKLQMPKKITTEERDIISDLSNRENFK